MLLFSFIFLLLFSYANTFATNNNFLCNKLIKNNISLQRGKELYNIKSNYYLDGPLNYKQIKFFFNNGYLIVENLINDNTLNKLHKLNFDKIEFNSWEKYNILLSVANKIGEAVAQLTPIVSHGDEDLHILKDALYIYDGCMNENINCYEWHIDNKLFWPCDDNSIGPGINAWLTLDNIDINGGGLCIAPSSHSKIFLDCRDEIGKGSGKLSLNSKKKLDNICFAPILNAGDVILTTRYLFHRTSEFNNPEKRTEKKRYIVRYMPSSSIMNGMSKLSINNKYPNKTIKSLNEKGKYKNKFPEIKLKKKLIKKYNYDFNDFYIK